MWRLHSVIIIMVSVRVPPWCVCDYSYCVSVVNNTQLELYHHGVSMVIIMALAWYNRCISVVIIMAFVYDSCGFKCGYKHDVSVVNTFLTEQIQLSYLPCIKYFGQPISVSFPIERNVHDEECVSLVSVFNGCTSFKV